MAKGKKSVAVEVNTSQAPSKSSAPDPWQTREDVADLIRPTMIRSDKARHGRAIEAMRATLDHEENRMQPKSKARSGRKVSSRNIGRR
jgi:hypothetical protein